MLIPFLVIPFQSSHLFSLTFFVFYWKKVSCCITHMQQNAFINIYIYIYISALLLKCNWVV